MKKYISTLLLASLFFPVIITNQAQAASSIKITSTKQAGGDILLTWKYYKLSKIKKQIIKVTNQEDQFERLFYPSKSARSYRLSNLQVNKKYIVEISEIKKNITSSKTFFLYDKPSTPSNLSVRWSKDTLLMDWDYSGPLVKEWLITATGTDGKEYLSTSTNSSLNSYKLQGLSSNMGYTIILRGSNAAGIGKFTNATASKSAPSPSKNLRVQPISDDGKSVILSWDYSGPNVNKWLIGIRASGYARDLETLSLTGKERSVELRGLSESGTYRFILVGVNEYGNAAEVTSTYTASVPIKAPTNLKATPQHQSIKLNWTAPYSDKSPISGYRVDYTPISSLKWTSIITSNNDSSIVIPNLKNGDQYKFRVSAIAGNISGLLSTEITALAGLIPGVPTSLQAKPGDLKMDLSWSPPKGNILSYIVEYKLSSDSLWTRIEIPTGSSITIPDLIGGKPYNFRVAAESESGLGQFTNAITSTPISQPTAPVLSFTMGSKAVNLSWSVPNDNGSPITGYKVFQRIGNGIKQQLGTSLLTINKLIVTNLNAGETYHYEVLAVNAVGDGPLSNSISTNVTDKPELTTLTAVGGNRTVTLSWVEPINNGSTILAYKLERAGNGSNFTTISDTISGTSYTDTNLINGTRYEYRLSSRNSQGWSQSSVVVAGTPIGSPSAVSNLVIEPFIEELKISWSALSGTAAYTGGSQILGYKVYMRSTSSQTWNLAPGGVLGGIPSAIPSPSPSPSPSASASSAPAPIAPIATNLVVSDLNPGEKYDFKIVAFTSFGDGAESEVRSGSPYGAPAAPIDLTAVGSDKKVTLSWGTPFRVIHIPATAVYKYKIEYSLDGVSWIPAKSDVSTLTTEVTGLTNGYPYSFRVTTGYTVGGRSAYGESSVVTMTTRGVPTGPQNLTLSRLSPTSVRVDWAPPVSTGGSPILFYSIESSSSGNSWQQENFALAASSSYVINNVSSGDPLMVRMKAFNTLICDATAETGYNEARTVLNSARTNMLSRGGTILIDSDFEGIDLDLSADGIQDGNGDPGDPLATPPIPAIPSRKTMYAPGQYRWSFVAANGTKAFILDSLLAVLDDRTKHCGSSYVIGQIDSIPAPTPLSGLKLIQVGNGSISLSWNGNPSAENITNYRVEYSLDGSSYITYGSPVLTNTVTISNLINNRQYYVRVSAVNSSGTGLGSTIIATPTGPSPVLNLSATAYDKNVTLTWALPVNPQVIISAIRVRFSSDNGNNYTLHGDLPSNSITTNIDSLVNSQQYLFEVTVLTNLGNSTPVTATSTPQPILPSQVRNLIGTLNALSVNLSWNPPLNTGIGQLSYKIEYKKDNSTNWIIAKGDEQNTSYTISNLDPSWTYNFRVTAINGSGAGPTSSVNVTT